jgi:hypothetical protein
MDDSPNNLSDCCLRCLSGGFLQWRDECTLHRAQASGAADNEVQPPNDPVVSSAATPAHSKSEYKRRAALGDPNVLPPATPPAQADKEPTRYEMELDWDGAEMVSAADGDFVRWEDVAHLFATTQAPAPAAPVLSDEQIKQIDRALELGQSHAHQSAKKAHFQGGRDEYAGHVKAIEAARAILAAGAGAMGEKT